MAYENLAKRTDLDGVKSVCMALQQAERYGTPLGADAARDGAGKPRHAHVGSREEGRRAAAQAHRADDPVLPAGAVRRHSRPGRDPRDGDAGHQHRRAGAVKRASRSCIRHARQEPRRLGASGEPRLLFFQSFCCASICRR